MSMTRRLTTLSTDLLPLSQARELLLPPVRLARAAAVGLATTVRHWELVLEGADHAWHGGERDATKDASPVDAASVEDTSPPNPDGLMPTSDAAELPVPDWAELSFADAQSHLASCDEDDLRVLLDYEQSHGHRPQYTLMLEQRLARTA